MQAQHSADTPFFVAEFQDDASNGFGTSGQEGCNALVNQESVRVLWKNNYSFAIKMPTLATVKVQPRIRPNVY